MYYSHYSFDLWFTLIKSNPNFKNKRALYFYKMYNSKNKTLAEVEHVFRHVDLMCNAINEKTGANIDCEEMYLMVLYELNNEKYHIQDIDLEELCKNMENLFFENPPSLFNSLTLPTLDTLKNYPDTTMNILSNTGFVKGNTLRKLLTNLDISKYFNFQLYSDEMHMSKPNTSIFNILVREINSIRLSPIALKDIIHIGDNILADIKGAESIGINTFLINTNDKSIQNLVKL